MTLTAVVAEDQPLAREHLRRMLADIDGVECVGEAADGVAALALIRRVQPDLLFLDIEMPGMSGLEVLRRADPKPFTVFTTAYDQHAVTAFELHALDYLLKPFTETRLRAAIDRARAQPPNAADLVPRTEASLSPTGPITRVFVRRRGRIVPVQVDRVEHIESRDDHVRLWEGDRSHLVRVALKDLVRRLDPERFVRVHRSHVVNLDFVSAFVPTPDGRIELSLHSGKTLVTSRARAPDLRSRLRIP